MGFMTLVNITKKEYICVGKPGEEPLFQVLKEMKRLFQWNIESDFIEFLKYDNEFLEQMGHPKIEYMNDDDEQDDDVESNRDNSDNIDGEDTEVQTKNESVIGQKRKVDKPIWTDRGQSLPWQNVSKLWENLRNKDMSKCQRTDKNNDSPKHL